MYGEDADLCLRAARLGARPMITPEATIIHHGGASETCSPASSSSCWPPNPRSSIAIGQCRCAFPGNICWPCGRPRAGSPCVQAPHRFESSREKAETWREVWEARRHWRFGYAKGAPIEAEMAAAAPADVQFRSIS